MNLDANTRLQAIGNYVHDYMVKSYDKRSAKDKANLETYLLGPEYRWQHTLRVAQFGKLIAENEDADLELVIATCLLHDIAWFDTTAEKSREHGRLGAEIAKPFLEKMGFSPEQVTPICNAIAEHVVEGKPETLVAKIICDADDVDRFGPYRVLQWCFSDINDYEKLAAKLRDRIHRLEHYREKNPLFTSTGRQLFSEQLNLQIRFFSEFIGEKALSVMPQL